MRQLFWKEWHELRLLPPAAALCVVLFVLGAKVFVQDYDPAHRFTFDDTMLPLLGTWMLFGLLAGASLFAQEVGSGTLQFLSALPTSRSCVWAVKAVTALGVMLACVLSSALVWAVTDAFVFQGAFFHDSFWKMPGAAVSLGAAMLVLAGVFAVALAVSPFLDRSISAVVASLLVAITFLILGESLANQYANYNQAAWSNIEQTALPARRALEANTLQHTHDVSLISVVFLVLSLLVFPAISYWTFTRGESLRSAKRFRVGALAGVVSLGVAGLVFLAGYGLQLW